MPFVDLKGAKFHYQWDGAESAPVLVLSNSLASAITMWEPQVAPFSKQFRVLRYDQRGHGQTAVTPEEYRSEVARLEQFLRTGGASLREPAEQARDRASAEMQFEEAARLHERSARIAQVQAAGGELPRTLDRLAGVAVVPSSHPEAIQLWFLIGGCWQAPQLLWLSEIAGAGKSMDHRLREIVAALEPRGGPSLEHLALLTRWHTSSWRDGEWIEMEWPAKVPYRKLVNAIARVAYHKS